MGFSPQWIGVPLWGEATTQRVRTRKEVRVTNPACPLRVQRQAREQACQRVRNVLTQQVKIIEGREFSVHAAFESVESGQLRFLGSRFDGARCQQGAGFARGFLFRSAAAFAHAARGAWLTGQHALDDEALVVRLAPRVDEAILGQRQAA